MMNGLRGRLALIVGSLIGSITAHPARSRAPGTPGYSPNAPATAWGMSIPKRRSQRQKRLDRRRGHQ